MKDFERTGVMLQSFFIAIIKIRLIASENLVSLMHFGYNIICVILIFCRIYKMINGERKQSHEKDCY